MSYKIKKIAVLGGGTAGWSAAALLAQHYRHYELQVVLIESPTIGKIGVGEATVPGIINIHQQLNIDEPSFLKATGATFKLGIEFQDWSKVGEQFFHPFSDFGVKIEEVDFHQCWLKLRHSGFNVPIQDFSLCSALASKGKFAQPDIESENALAWYGYAYHFDASKYATFLRDYSENLGVRRILDTVISVEKNAQTNFIETLVLSSGQKISADFFIDCSGFSSLLLSGEYQVPYEDWSHWLPCNKAWAVQTENLSGDLPPYTSSKAMQAGWKWKIPLRHRFGNGYVFSDKFIDEETAKQELLNTLEEPVLNEPRLLSFCAGMRQNFWVNNCAAVGLSSGFIEPLESTSISLMHTGVSKIIAHLPDLNLLPEGIRRANELNRCEYERIRDFIILHYWASRREDTPFWKSFKGMQLPAPLEEKISAYLGDGRLLSHQQESFRAPSWLAMYSGFDLIAKNSAASAEGLSEEFIQQVCRKMAAAIEKSASYAPAHRDFLDSV